MRKPEIKKTIIPSKAQLKQPQISISQILLHAPESSQNPYIPDPDEGSGLDGSENDRK